MSPNHTQYQVFKEQVAKSLAELQVISPEVLEEYGPDFVLRKIAKDFNQVDKSKILNPWRVVGRRLEVRMEEQGVSQSELSRRASEELAIIGGACFGRERVSRMISGQIRTDLLRAMAFARVLGFPLEDLSPWSYQGRNETGVIQEVRGF